MKRSEIIKRALLLIVITYVFLLSIKLMGGSFKLFGKEFAEQLINFTASPFVGLFIGILATAIVQSSSVTTSVVVGLTASNALTVAGAIPIIMGANIGTSITNTIVSLGHIKSKQEFKQAFEVATIHDIFNFIVVLILFPIEMIFAPLEHAAIYLTDFFVGSTMSGWFTSPLSAIINPVSKPIIAALSTFPIILLGISFALLFLSLRYFVKTIRPFAESEFKELLNKHIFERPIRSFGFGLILTGIVQSSSVTSSLIVPLVGVSIVTLERAFPYLLGANIGTTFTAFMASLVTGSPAAITVALEHVLFNTTGSLLIYPIRNIPISISRSLAQFSLRSKFIPITYITTLFYVLPAVVIVIFH